MTVRTIIRYLIVIPYLWARKHAFLLLAIILVLGVTNYVGYVTDRDVRGQLNLAVLHASTDLGGLYRAYAATEHFTDRRILEYCSTDMIDEVHSWTFTSSRVSLQALGKRGAVFYDSRDGGFYSYSAAEAIPGALRIPHRLSPAILTEPLYVVSQVVDENWTLRTVITTGNYLRTQVEHFAITSLPISVGILSLFFLPLYYRRVVTHQHFESVIDTLLEFPPESKSADEFVNLLPQLVRKALDFDSAAVYLVRAEALELLAVAPNERGGNKSALNRSIPRKARFLEAAAVRWKCTLCVDYLRDRPRVAGASQEPRRHRRLMRVAARMKSMKINASSHAPYVAVPILDPQDGTVIGVLTAQKRLGFEESNATELETLVRLVMLLFDYARATLRVKEIFNRTIRQTRQVALGTVVPVLAHNVKGRLAPVAWIARDLAKKFTSIDQATAEARLKQVEQEMEYCIALIDRISVYRKIGVKTDASRPSEPIDLNDLLKKVCAFFEAYCETRQIRLESHFEADFQPRVAIDELDLLQVISNLFINADEAFGDIPSQGSERQIELFVERSTIAKGVRIRIADNGPSIPAHLHAKIFDDNFTTKTDGTGTGLPYCRTVIRQTGGTLELDTQVLRGATFIIYLPISEVTF